MLTPSPSLPAVFYMRKRSAFIILIGALAFVCLGYDLFIHANAYSKNSYQGIISFLPALLRTPGGVKATGIACMLFFGLCASAAGRLMIKKTIFLSITTDGIQAHKMPFLRWDEIDGFKQINIVNNEFLGVILSDTDAYFKKLNPSTQKIARWGSNMCGTPYTIQPFLGGLKTDTLIMWLQEYKSQYGSKK